MTPAPEYRDVKNTKKIFETVFIIRKALDPEIEGFSRGNSVD
jgi:hypothetical protein